MTQTEALKLALEALEVATTPLAKDRQEVLRARAAIREALAQPEQDPVAYTTGHCENHKQKGGCQLHNLQCGWPDCDRKPITTPPQRKPLTWQPIETAPKDGTDILAMYIHIDTQIVHAAFWIGADNTDDEADIGWWSYEYSEVSRIKLDDWMEPTHWMPLPTIAAHGIKE